MIQCLHKELELKKDYISSFEISSIYFGGGTPSLLSPSEIYALLDHVNNIKTIQSGIEITLETNPDDMTTSFLNGLKSSGINRLSVGIQSFFDEDLKAMNRAHDSCEAESALTKAQEVGFTDFSLDLIYGSHTTTDEMWIANVEKALAFKPNHISAYCMTIEDNTAFGSWLKSGKISEINDERANRQYQILQDMLKGNGYMHYEISNFALPSHMATHNSNYWKGKPNIGIGPSAHSFLYNKRFWNVANNAQYMNAIDGDQIPETEEPLSIEDQFNEYVMTGLRTMWGVNLNAVEKRFGPEYSEHIIKSLHNEWLVDKVIQKDSILVLAEKGKNFADRIASMLFYG
jgi:oxygen-independent coproporphyrinogen-3 oxidase